MDSSWEVKLAIWMDEKNIIWDRNKKRHQFIWTDSNNKKHRYYPDFYIPSINLYLDPKNPHLIKCDKFKIEQVQKENNIKIEYGNLEYLKNVLTIL